MGSPDASSSPPAPAASPAPRSRRAARLLRLALLTTAIGVLVMALAIAALFAWLTRSTSGIDALIANINRYTPVQIEARQTFGALNREFGAEFVRVRAGSTTVEIAKLRAQLRDYRVQPLRLDFTHLQAEHLRVVVRPSATPDGGPTQHIGAPLDVSADRLEVDRFDCCREQTQFTLTDIRTRAAIGPWGYFVENGRLAHGLRKGTLSGRVDAQRPFAIEAQGTLAASLRDQPITAQVTASGSLVDLHLRGVLEGAGSTGTALLRIGAFDEAPIKQLDVDLNGVDPQAWHPQAPQAALAIKAQLRPDKDLHVVSGPVQIVNSAPGPIDASRIPARAASALVTANAAELRAEKIEAQLPKGSARGEFAMRFGSIDWSASAQMSGVDPALIHSRLKPLAIDGKLQARREGDVTKVQGDLANKGSPLATLVFDAQITPELASIHKARLALGDGALSATGSVGLARDHRIQLTGQVDRFDPGVLLRDLDMRVNGRFDLDGTLQPQPAGRLRFELNESRAWGRPLVGRGRVDLDAAQRLDVDVELGVRSARLVVKGGLGGANRTLDFDLDVPALPELVASIGKAKIAGSLRASGSASGDWRAPQVDVDLRAERLRYGDHALEAFQAHAQYGGGNNGSVRLQAGVDRYALRNDPKLAVRAVTLAASGTLAAHGIRIQGTTERGEGALIYAQGGWRDDAWRGELRELAIGVPLEMRLLAPSPLVLGAGGVEFGPARVALKHVRIEDAALKADAAGVRTRGRFFDLKPMLLVPPVEGGIDALFAPVAGRTPLTLKGEWDLRLGSQVDGRVLVEHTGGDLYAGRGPESALGLIDVRFDGTVVANEMTVLARIESAKRGGIGAQFNAWLESSPDAGWQLAQKKPWLIAGALDLPTMDWVNALLSEHIRANVRLGGAVTSTVRIEGTPAAPVATGRLVGDDLRVAWIEQGVRLESGRLRARLEDDLFVLDELRFAGPPRVLPNDKRLAGKASQEGSVNASGQMRLRDFQGVIQVAADRLPLLQQPDRWIVASGGANIETSNKHVQLNGAVAAAAGFVDFSRRELPTLASDVVIRRSSAPIDTRPPQVTLGFDLGIDLGEAFYVRGNGLDARVEGAVRLRSAGRGAVSAVGSIAAVDGVYEGFGQKLKIARGRLNFQGAPENPGLDILAVRPGLPVEVGVTITRTASNPLVRLHSDPPLPDLEALSWLVLGRPVDQGGSDNIALAQAAAGLLAGSGEGFSTRAARAIGIDELSVRSGNLETNSLLPLRGVAGTLRSDRVSTSTVAGEIITIGKRLNDALSLSYEQAVAGTSRIVQLNYQLTDRLSVIARGGTLNALDFVYTITFD